MFTIIPAYKPDERLLQIIEDLHSQTDFRIIVVNDGSGPEFDHIFDAIPSYVTLLKHEVNRGKGRAMKTGFEYILSLGEKSGGVVIVDADGQHLIKDVKNVCAAFEEHPDDLVIGSRKFTGKVPLRSRFGNSLTKVVFAIASGVKVHDTQTGLRVIPLSRLDSFVAIKGERYEYEMNMLLHAAEEGIHIHEVFIDTVYINDNDSSHFNVIKDSIKIYAVIFKFVFSSLFAFLVDFVMLYVMRWIFADIADPTLYMLVSVYGARAISSTVNFIINRKIVFKDKGRFWVSLLKYYSLVIVIAAANFALMELFCNILFIPLFWSKIITEVLLFSASYFVQRTLIFKHKQLAK